MALTDNRNPGNEAGQKPFKGTKSHSKCMTVMACFYWSIPEDRSCCAGATVSEHPDAATQRMSRLINCRHLAFGRQGQTMS